MKVIAELGALHLPCFSAPLFLPSRYGLFPAYSIRPAFMRLRRTRPHLPPSIESPKSGRAQRTPLTTNLLLARSKRRRTPTSSRFSFSDQLLTSILPCGRS